MGYSRAGWAVIGVDINPQPDYPFAFIQGDALEFIAAKGKFFDAIHASPPCQASTKLRAYTNKSPELRGQAVNLIPETRAALEATGRPWVIENVSTAAAGLRDPITLCGAMFGLTVYRHRGFESNVRLTAPTHQPHTALCTRNSYLPTPERPFMSIHGRNGHQSKAWVRAAAEAMGVEWMTSINPVCEAIPPAYTEWIGRQLP